MHFLKILTSNSYLIFPNFWTNLYTSSSTLIKRHTYIHTYVRTSIFPLLLFPHKRLSFSKSIEIDARFYRSVLHPESPRRSNLVDASLEEAHAADRSIPKKFLVGATRRLAPLSRIYARQIEGKGENLGRGTIWRISVSGMKQGNATRFSLSMVGRDDRKRGGRIYEGGTEGGRMRASTSRRRRMLIREIHQGILVPRF